MRRRLGVGNFWGVLCLCFVGIYLCNAVGTAANEAFSRMLGREAINEIEAVTLASPMWVNLIFTVLLAPLFEEIFFRKLLIDRLYPYGEIPAVLISGIAFGLVHGNFSQLFYAVAVGLIFGFVYTRTGNIRYSIAMHMILNLVGGVYAAEAQKLLEGASWGWSFSDIPGELIGMVMMIVYLGIMLLAVVGSIVTYTHYRRRILAPHLASVPLSSRDWSYVLLLNPSVWVFLAVCALMFVL
jgi:membrane protease YdiL (CAAX protease family)